MGGVLAWWVLSPLAIQLEWIPSMTAIGATSEADWEAWATGVLYSDMLRPLGIGVLIGGAMAGVAASLPAMKAAIESLSKSQYGRWRCSGNE